MWKTIFITLGLFYAGVTGIYNSCLESAYQECNLPYDFDFPETKDDWKRMCPTLIYKLICLSDFSDECGYDDVVTEQTFREMWRIRDDSCREEFEIKRAAKNEVCQFRAERACRIQSIAPDYFPGNRRELLDICSNLHTVKQCIADDLRKCKLKITENEVNDSKRELSTGDYQTLKELRRLMDVMTEICDENSNLYRSFVPHLPCLRSTLETEQENQACRDYSNNAVEILRNRIEQLARISGENDDKYREVRSDLMHCLRTLFHLNCFITLSMTECDSSLKQPILEVFEKVLSLDYQCPAYSRINVIELMDALKLVTHQEIYVKELIQVNSFF